MASSLPEKQKIMEMMQPAEPDPMMQMQQQLAVRGAVAEVSKSEAEVENTQADTQLKLAKAGEAAIKPQLSALEAGARLGGFA